MKTQKQKIKRTLKKNYGKILIIGTIAMIGIAANLNLMLLDFPVIGDINIPDGQRYSVAVYEVESKTIRETTAYNAGDPAQTDGSPCITADGTNACRELAQGEKICAANFVPLGTEIYINGFGFCTVKDRMNSRFQNRVDVAMEAHEKARAVKWGLQSNEVSILK
jgi:3D (Asp-Asp-Asp) domain-containing protein